MIQVVGLAIRLAIELVVGPEQPPTVAAMVEALRHGRLVIEQVRFRPEDDRLVAGFEPTLRQAARALSQTRGRYLVLVSPERQVGFPVDTILSRRRAMMALRRLIEAGSNPRRLVGAESMGDHGIRPAMSVAPGDARIELIRISCDSTGLEGGPPCAPRP
jgi:hypothetical protein